MSDAICRKCKDLVELRFGGEHTGFCDECAQTMIVDLITTLDRIRDSDFEPPAVLADHLQGLAADVLTRHGIADWEDEE